MTILNHSIILSLFLIQSVFTNDRGLSVIDWNNPKALIALNKALLDNDFGITFWDMPEDHLCPTIPSRINYLNWINELLQVFCS